MDTSSSKPQDSLFGTESVEVLADDPTDPDEKPKSRSTDFDPNAGMPVPPPPDKHLQLDLESTEYGQAAGPVEFYEATDERQLLEAAERLLTAMEAFNDASTRYLTRPTSCLEMDETMSGMSTVLRDFETDFVRLHQAIGMIEEGPQEPAQCCLENTS